MTSQLILIPVRSLLARIVLIFALLLCFAIAGYGVRWYLGSEMAWFAPSPQRGAADFIEAALALSPSDPFSHWAAGFLLQKEIGRKELERAVRHFEIAASLSPHDFRYWVDLGRAREKLGDVDAAEDALRRGVELAPSYAWPRWHFGNFLVRRGRYDEGFAVLRVAADADSDLQGQIFDLAWRVYGGDVEQVKAAFGKGNLQAQFVHYLVQRGRLEDGIKMWSSLSAGEKQQQPAVGEAIINALISQRRFRHALALVREMEEARASGEIPTEGAMLNGGFEQAVSQAPRDPFSWRVRQVSGAHIAIDAARRSSGTRSLRIDFNASSSLELDGIAQTVVVQPSGAYRLQFNARTETLKTAGPPVVEVVADGSVIARSEPLANGDNDWHTFTLDFNVPTNVEAVIVQISRTPCGVEGTVCPIFGTVWYDDFSLRYIGSSSGAGAGSGPARDSGSASR